MALLRSFDSDDIRRLAPMGAVIAALRDCFAADPAHIDRQGYPVAGGEFLLMPAVDTDAAGIKLIMIQPANAARGKPIISGTYVLFDAAAGHPEAVLDGAALTNLRTPAISALATDALARRDVTTLGIIGSGPQAIGHVEAMLCVRPSISDIVISSRDPDHAQAVVDLVLANPAVMPTGSVKVGTYAEAAACDIVCTATRATEPILDVGMIRPGAHINAVGSYRTDMRELSTALVAACTVVVDEIGAAHHEAGDLALAVADGGWSWDQVAGDLTDVSAGTLVRRAADEITFFKSVGLAVQDLVVARLVANADAPSAASTASGTVAS
ncbi:MAG TPA: ornithine cyclodeaminase family protein [Ilumatobacteraceae bacterium]